MLGGERVQEEIMTRKQNLRMEYIKSYRVAWRRYSAIADVSHILGGLPGLDKDKDLMEALLRAEKRYRKELREAEDLLATHCITLRQEHSGRAAALVPMRGR